MNPFRNHIPLRLKPDLVGRIRRDYRSGMTIVEVADKHDLSRVTIKKVLDDASIVCDEPPVKARRRGRRTWSE